MSTGRPREALITDTPQSQVQQLGNVLEEAAAWADFLVRGFPT